MTLTPKQLILQLLSAAPDNAVSVRGLTHASDLLGISKNALRVALTRLKTDGMVLSVRRGMYTLGPRAIPLQRQIADWRMREALVRDDWDQSWVGVHAGCWPRADRTWLRARERVLQMLGFQTPCDGLWLRPNNLDLSVTELHGRLVDVNVPAATPVFEMRALGPFEERARSLWDRAAMNESYREGIQQLAAARLRLQDKPVEPAAAEAFEVGGHAIRHILFDPLLPDPLVDVSARRDYLKAVKSFVQFGRALWLQVLSKTENWTPEKMAQDDRG